jgi:D-3-phosphoglycerate dehydrogenase / 2-oxoglutarate reductase
VKVVFLDTVHTVLEDRLTKAGYDCAHAYTETGEELARVLAAAEGIVIRSRIVLNRDNLALAPRLKFIARAGSGLENIDLAECENRNVLVFNSPEGNRTAVAEHATGMLLSLLNHLKKTDSEVRQGVRLRAENRGIELEGKILGIIGYGVMGCAFAKRISGFGCQILAYDKYKHGISHTEVTECALFDIQREADIVSFHVPLTRETLHYFNDRFLDSFSKPIILINTSRGPVCSTEAVARGLGCGKLLGACLDVIEEEETSFEGKLKSTAALEYLFRDERVLLSPHIAGWTHESHFKLSDVLADKILNTLGAVNL